MVHKERKGFNLTSPHFAGLGPGKFAATHEVRLAGLIAVNRRFLGEIHRQVHDVNLNPCRSCKKGSADAKVHAKAELCHNGCSTLLPSRAQAGYAQSRTVDTHHTENRCGGRVVVGLDRLANNPSSPTGVHQRNTGFWPG